MRKQTKIWTTKDGKRIRICDMTDNHLSNTVRMLDRMAATKTWQLIKEGVRSLRSMHGEMAIDAVESGIDGLIEYGIEPQELFPIYDNLCADLTRREIQEKRK